MPKNIEDVVAAIEDSVDKDNVSEDLDSTTEVLGDGATFTGKTFSVKKYSAIVGSVYADRAGTLYVEQSSGGSDFDVQSTYAYVGGVQDGFTVPVVGVTARVRFTNAAGAAQTAFRLYVCARRV